MLNLKTGSKVSVNRLFMNFSHDRAGSFNASHYPLICFDLIHWIRRMQAFDLLESPGHLYYELENIRKP